MTPVSRFILDRRYWLLPLAVWSGVVFASLAWNWHDLTHHAHDMALNRAQFIFKMVESVRLWNARHGGVYAEVDGETPPNPHLEVPERDLTTPSGRQLTMVNPAYMTRQLAGVVEELADIRVHLTSLKPINPGNAPTAWERSMLEGFERGAGEQSVIAGEGTAAVFRYMAPLYTDRACLKCHEKQGYRLGDVRGGVSVSFAAAPLFASTAVQQRNLLAIHLGVWLLLAGLTLFALHHFRRQLLSLQDANERQERVVLERTAQLREEVRERTQAEAQLRLFIESSGEGIYAVDMAGHCTLINRQALALLGYTEAAAVVGQPIHALIHHSYADGRPHPVGECALHTTLREGQAVHHDDDVFWRADGSSFPVEYRSHPIRHYGELFGAVVTFADVTARKREEEELRKLSQAVEHGPAAAVITDVAGRIEYVNQKFIELTGYQAREVLGQNPRLWQSGQTPAAVYRDLWGTIAGGRQWRGELLNRKRSGELFWGEASISPITNPRGEVTHYIAVEEDITARKRQQAQIWHRAHHDALTGLPNRTLFRERLEQALVQAREGGHLLALLYVDLDGFKGVNDTLGHEAGDHLLRQVAQRLHGCVRDTDTVARLAGDEFAVILTQVKGRAGVGVVAGKVIEALAWPYRLGNEKAVLSGSVGIALCPDHAVAADPLIQHADAAMYRAKQAGRNMYCFYN